MPVSPGMICCVLVRDRLTQVLVQNSYHNESAVVSVLEFNICFIFMHKRENVESKINKDRGNLFVCFFICEFYCEMHLCKQQGIFRTCI